MTPRYLSLVQASLMNPKNCTTKCLFLIFYLKVTLASQIKMSRTTHHLLLLFDFSFFFLLSTTTMSCWFNLLVVSSPLFFFFYCHYYNPKMIMKLLVSQLIFSYVFIITCNLMAAKIILFTFQFEMIRSSQVVAKIV